MCNQDWFFWGELMKKAEIAAGLLFVLASGTHAQEFSAQQIKLGADIFARNCAACHGIRMKNPEGAFDLLTFPKDQPGRFRNSVSKGKNSMPPWESLLNPEQIDALWAYVVAGESK